MLKAIVATDLRGCIGKDNTLPWRMRADLQHFKQMTLGSTIVMGRRTKESLPGTLPGRTELVLSSSRGTCTEQVAEVLRLAEQGPVWIIGGAETLRAFEDHITEMWVTEIQTTIEEGDTHYQIPERFHWEEMFTINADEHNQYNATVYKLY